MINWLLIVFSVTWVLALTGADAVFSTRLRARDRDLTAAELQREHTAAVRIATAAGSLLIRAIQFIASLLLLVPGLAAGLWVLSDQEDNPGLGAVSLIVLLVLIGALVYAWCGRVLARLEQKD